MKRPPRDGIAAMVQPRGAPEAHYCVPDATRHLINNQMINLADLIPAEAVHFRPVNLFARDKVVIWMGSTSRHVTPPLEVRFPTNQRTRRKQVPLPHRSPAPAFPRAGCLGGCP